MNKKALAIALVSITLCSNALADYITHDWTIRIGRLWFGLEEHMHGATFARSTQIHYGFSSFNVEWPAYAVVAVASILLLFGFMFYFSRRRRHANAAS